MSDTKLTDWIVAVTAVVALLLSIVGIIYTHLGLKEAAESRKQAARGIRAYVGVDKVEAQDLWQFRFAVRNFGPTAATHVLVKYSCGFETEDGQNTVGTYSVFISKNGVETSGEMPDPEAEGAVFNPGVSVPMICKSSPPKSVKAVHRLLQGQILFKDANQESHQAFFCYSSPLEPLGQMFQCNKGNSAD